MPQAFASCQARKLMTVRASENNTSGGSSETELNELTVVPCNNPSAARAVTTATPVGKTSRVFLNSPEVKAMAWTRGINSGGQLADLSNAVMARPGRRRRQ